MRLLTLLATLTLVCATALPGHAQPSSRVFEDLGRYVQAGDILFVTDRRSETVQGRVVSIAPTEIVLDPGGGSRSLRAQDIGWIAKRGDRWWDGPLVGSMLALPLAAAAGASCSPDCAEEVPAAALTGVVFGAGIGAIVDAAWKGRQWVYGTRPDSVHALRPAPPVAAVADLWSRVTAGDTVDVLLRSGEEIVGHYRRTSTSTLELTRDDVPLDIAADRIGRVRRRGSYFRLGTLIGAVAMVSIVTVQVATRAGDQESAFFPAYVPLVIGMAIGRSTTRHAIVYRAPNGTAEPQRPESR